jgi:hypothetical protein
VTRGSNLNFSIRIFSLSIFVEFWAVKRHGCQYERRWQVSFVATVCRLRYTVQVLLQAVRTKNTGKARRRAHYVDENIVSNNLKLSLEISLAIKNVFFRILK